MAEFLVAAGDLLEVRFVGPRPARLVFLHEGLGCAALWRDFPDRVSERTGLGALVYSRRGYGASEPVESIARLEDAYRTTDLAARLGRRHVRPLPAPRPARGDAG